MDIIVNGRPRPLPRGGTLADLVVELHRDLARRGIAVAVNGAVVPREAWDDTRLAGGDHVEVLAAAQGG